MSKDFSQMKKEFKDRLPTNALDMNNLNASQYILMLKSVGSNFLEDQDKDVYQCTTSKMEDGNYGFSERMVNHLMQLAFNMGRIDVDKDSYDKGHADCWQEIMNTLGVKEKDDY